MASHSPNTPPDHGNNEILTYAIMGILVCAGVVVGIRFLSVAALYVYAPLTFPVWLAGKHLTTIGSVAILLIYMGICIAIVLYYYTKKNQFNLKWVAIGVSFLIIALIEMIIGTEASFYTRQINFVCNPKDTGFLALFHCQNKLRDMLQLSFIELMKVAILPNLPFMVAGVFESITGLTRVLNTHPKNKTKKNLNVKDLMASQSELQPHLLIYSKLNPNSLPSDKGQLRLMDDSRKFIYQNNLISSFSARPMSAADYGKQTDGVGKIDNYKTKDLANQDRIPVLDVKRFEQVMIEQLGSIWTNTDNLTPAEIIVLSIALPRACCIDVDITSDLSNNVTAFAETQLNEIWRWVNKDIDHRIPHLIDHTPVPDDIGLGAFPQLEEYKAIIDNWITHPIAQDIIKHHAYTRTVIFKALTEAKKLGVLAPTSFRWLKFYDRQMWALVENVNRPSGFAENIAVLSHYRAESKANQAIYKPTYQAAFSGLMERVAEFKYPDEHIKAWYDFYDTGCHDEMLRLHMYSDEGFARTKDEKQQEQASKDKQLAEMQQLLLESKDFLIKANEKSIKQPQITKEHVDLDKIPE